MTYRVAITPTAYDEIADAFAYIYADSPSHAQIWLAGLYAAIDSLETFPTRCPVAPDSVYVGQQLRHLLFKSHRIIFRVEENRHTVRILGFRHGARLPMGEDQPE